MQYSALFNNRVRRLDGLDWAAVEVHELLRIENRMVGGCGRCGVYVDKVKRNWQTSEILGGIVLTLYSSGLRRAMLRVTF